MQSHAEAICEGAGKTGWRDFHDYASRYSRTSSTIARRNVRCPRFPSCRYILSHWTLANALRRCSLSRAWRGVHAIQSDVTKNSKGKPQCCGASIRAGPAPVIPGVIKPVQCDYRRSSTASPTAPAKTAAITTRLNTIIAPPSR